MGSIYFVMVLDKNRWTLETIWPKFILTLDGILKIILIYLHDKKKIFNDDFKIIIDKR